MSRLAVFTGCMFSGKTSRMMLEVEKCKHAGREIHAFKPGIDDRYSDGEIVTHMGWSLPATKVASGSEISKHMLDEAKDLARSLIVVDEQFMIPGSAEDLIWLYQRGVDVVVATLDLSCWCKPFEEVQKLLPWATEVVKCAAACSVCGKDAFYTYRKVDNEDEVFVGGAESYEPRCLAHHPNLQEE